MEGPAGPTDDAEMFTGFDEANHDLQKVFSSSCEQHSTSWCFQMEGSPDRRPASAVSTAATTTFGPTPPPWCPTSASSPGNTSALPEEPGARGPKRNVRKVFVGGVPQDMTQDELHSVFSEHASIKKAWLQKYRAGPGAVHHPNKHRGFGFVIFNDASGVDILLGDSFSRYLVLSDGKKLEVKRAVSSCDMEEDASAKDAQKAKHSSSNKGAAGPRQAGDSPVASPMSQTLPVMVPVAWQGNPAHSMMQQPCMMQQMPYAMPYVQGVAPYTSPATQPLPMVPAFPQGAPCGQAPQYFLAPQGMTARGQPQQYYLVNAAPQHGHYGMHQQVHHGGMLQQQPQDQMAPMTQKGMAPQEGAQHYYHAAVPAYYELAL